MLVFNIMKKVIQDDNARKKHQGQIVSRANQKALGGLNIEIEQMQNNFLPVKASGELPSFSSIALRYLTEAGLGFGVGKVMYGDDQIDQGYGAPSTWMQTTSTTLGAGIVSVALDQYFFSKVFGVDIGTITLNLPIQGDAEPQLEYRKRRDEWVESVKNSPELIGHLNDISKKALDSLQTELLFASALALAKAYHGYQRHNQSIGMMLGWALFGNIGLAAAQGYAKPLKENK